MNISGRDQRNEPFCQYWFAKEMAALYATLPNYDFGYTGETCIFCNLRGHIFSMSCDDLRTKLLRKMHISL